ncbi:Glyceraldehyde-3-phosphate dehydrogenase, partial [Galemys pyrenaicus]
TEWLLPSPLMDRNYMVYMVSYESTHGKSNSMIKAENGKLVINRKPSFISIIQEGDPTIIVSGDASAEYIVELIGIFTTLEKSLLLMPPMSVMGVHFEKYDNSLKVTINASCTTNCLRTLIRVIHDKVGVMEGLMTTHAILSYRRPYEKAFDYELKQALEDPLKDILDYAEDQLIYCYNSDFGYSNRIVALNGPHGLKRIRLYH